MVGGSELPFRLLCRKYGADLAYTPMLSSVRFAVDEEYRVQQFQTTSADRPLVAHFNGNDVDTIVAAAKYVDGRCDAVDINLGCPQRIAFTGHFGSYLLGEEDRGTVLAMVSALERALTVPVFVKIRLLDTIDDTIRLCKQLVEAGASLIAVHGRYRVNLVGRTGPGARDGPAHLDQIREIKMSLGDFPVISNGNVITWDDVEANANFTSANGIMSAEGILNDPTLFAPGLFNGSIEKAKAAGLLPKDKLDIANEYLDLVNMYPVPHATVLFHVRRICSEYLEKYQLMVDLMESVDMSGVRAVIESAKSIRDRCLRDGVEFNKDPRKAERVAEAAARRKREEGKRKEFEARMVRKAKRNGQEPDFYLQQGSENPTIDEIEELRSTPRDKAFEIWKQKHAQHCFAFHMDAQKCPRERACAFLHSDLAMSVLSYG